MNTALFEKLTGSLKQMKAIRAGTLQPARSTKLTPEHPRAVRTRLNMTQEEFADMIGVPLGTLRNWEQGHREPTGPAKALLIAAAKYPRQIALALTGIKRPTNIVAQAGEIRIHAMNSGHFGFAASSSGERSVAVHGKSAGSKVAGIKRKPATT